MDCPNPMYNPKIVEQVFTAGLKPRNMATNSPAGDGHRNGMVRQRSQVLNPKTGIWTKRGPNGQFMDGKQDGTPFKGVRKEK